MGKAPLAINPGGTGSLKELSGGFLTASWVYGKVKEPGVAQLFSLFAING